MLSSQVLSVFLLQLTPYFYLLPDAFLAATILIRFDYNVY